MADSRWRKIATPIIATCLFNHRGESEAEIRKALREVYPFGPRKMHPYKIWCDEVARQRGLKKETPKAARVIEHDPNQQGLFR